MTAPFARARASLAYRVPVLVALAFACRATEKEAAPVEAAQALAAPSASAGAPSPPAAASPDECRRRERDVKHQLASAYFVMNSDGAYLSAFDESWQGLEVCPDSEPLWYTFARLAEIGFHRFPMQVASARIENGAAAAALAQSRQPRSARIAVIDARARGDIESARRALALDPSYTPARVALAQALFDRQQIDEALPLSDTPDVPGAASLRALILLARAQKGDAKLAERLARRELTASWEALEPYDMKPIRCAAQEALGLALQAQHAPGAKKELEKAVQCGSTRAGVALRPGP